jgi:hypothetical protein
MKPLVELYKDREVRVNTFKIYKQFGYSEHRTFKNLINKNKSLFEERGLLINVSTDTINRSKGRPDEGYFLNERQFVLLVMLTKNTTETIDFKDRLEKEFSRMQTALANLSKSKLSKEYTESRTSGKVVYLQKTDVIRDFVDYATKQGSKNAKNYYTNFARMENSALFFLEQKYKNVREFLNIKQLHQISVADQVIEKALAYGMDSKMDYHDIYINLQRTKLLSFQTS